MTPCSHCRRRGAEPDSRWCRRCQFSRPIDAGAIPPPKTSTPPAPIAQRFPDPRPAPAPVVEAEPDFVIRQPPGSVIPGPVYASRGWNTRC